MADLELYILYFGLIISYFCSNFVYKTKTHDPAFSIWTSHLIYCEMEDTESKEKNIIF